MRSTSREHEERKLRPVERLSGPWKWADDLSTGGAEIVFLSLPGVVVLLNSGYEPLSVIFAVFVSIVVLSVGVAAGGCGWVRFDPPWPDWRVSTILFRITYYSLVMVLLGFTGGFVDATVGAWPAVAVIAFLGAGSIAVLPRSFVVTARTIRRVRAWHRWLFPPQHRY